MTRELSEAGGDTQPGPLMVIIVAFNNGPELNQCLRSIPRCGGDARVLVVDNSTDPAAKQRVDVALAEGLIDHLHRPDANVGFAQAVNLGLKLRSQHEDVLLLNPDVSLDEGCIEALRRSAALHDDVAILSPVVYSDPSVRTMTAGEQPTILRNFLHYSCLSRIFPSVHFLRGRYLFLDKHAEADRFVTWSAACVWLLPKKTIDEFGGLTERWFLYGEDIEYCHRVTKAGLKILLVADSRAYHGMAVSVSQADGLVNTMWPRSTYSYYVSEFNPGPIRRVLWKVVFSGGLLSRALPYRLRRSTRARGVRLTKLARAVWVADE